MIYTNYNIEEIKEKLKNCLTSERYMHSIGVMEMAAELAKQFNYNIIKAEIAGLLHDCAKCLSTEELEKYSYCLCECERESKKTWHAPIGALIAEKEYGITDKEILSAIRWHTIGKTNMSDFEKIIFIADKIEKRTREENIRQDIETALKKHNNLDAAMLKSFQITIESLIKRKLPICYQTIDVYNKFLKLKNKRHE